MNSKFLLGFMIGFLIDKISLFPLIIGFCFGIATTNLYNQSDIINTFEYISKKIKENLINRMYN